MCTFGAEYNMKSPSIEFDNTYAALPSRFYARHRPDPVASPQTLVVNEELARRLGFDPDWLRSEAGARFATGNEVLPGADPIALVYAGHQFGNWVPRLGDGRAHLLGEVVDEDGQRFDLQLKGSGRTTYSRGGDGRAPLGPVLREYLISEAMAAYGVPTTRALVAATTGEEVVRQGREPGGVLVRVASSHVRIGTMEYFASQRDEEALSILVDYVLDRHYPDASGGGALDLLRAVVEGQARLVAKWQLVGFIHGVMNTDNMLLAAETIDYGPCAFMNDYDLETVYSSIDRFGRYAYGNQPAIAQWNLARLAQALVPVMEGEQAVEEAQEMVDGFPDLFRQAYGEGMAKKLGLTALGDGDWPIIEDLLGVMSEASADYTLTFRRLARSLADDDELPEPWSKLLALPEEFGPWAQRWRGRLAEQDRSLEEVRAAMDAVNPLFIPRNHRVEDALNAAVHGDVEPFFKLLDVVKNPYQRRSSRLEFARPPAAGDDVQATFCGT